MDDRVEQCAHEILETVPVVMRYIRDQVRRRQAGGLSLPQFRTLTFLKRVRNASLSAVAEHLGLSLPAMSRLINGLVAGRLVGRQTVSTNRRQVALTLTARGRVTLEEARGKIRLRLAEAVKDLAPAEQKTILRAMGILQEVFDQRTVSNGSPKKAET
jgi:DNA-binding MarR family transcriptional regulator